MMIIEVSDRNETTHTEAASYVAVEDSLDVASQKFAAGLANLQRVIRQIGK